VCVRARISVFVTVFTHIHIHTIIPYTHSLSLCLSVSLTHSLSLSLSRTHIHSQLVALGFFEFVFISPNGGFGYQLILLLVTSILKPLSHTYTAENGSASKKKESVAVDKTDMSEVSVSLFSRKETGKGKKKGTETADGGSGSKVEGSGSKGKESVRLPVIVISRMRDGDSGGSLSDERGSEGHQDDPEGQETCVRQSLTQELRDSWQDEPGLGRQYVATLKEGTSVYTYKGAAVFAGPEVAGVRKVDLLVREEARGQGQGGACFRAAAQHLLQGTCKTLRLDHICKGDDFKRLKGMMKSLEDSVEGLKCIPSVGGWGRNGTWCVQRKKEGEEGTDEADKRKRKWVPTQPPLPPGGEGGGGGGGGSEAKNPGGGMGRGRGEVGGEEEAAVEGRSLLEDLPEGWTERITNQGTSFYQHKLTRTTQWKHPLTRVERGGLNVELARR
jgi:GNAT superfamily N-acetyltransferase